MSDDGYQVVTGALPAVVSVVEKINEPRYPTFKGIMAAKKKPVQVADAWPTCPWTLPRWGWRARRRGWRTSRRGRRGPAGVVVKDEGDGGVKAAGFLAERKFI